MKPPPAQPPLAALTGVVAIGRNEGERLRRCLRSVPPGVPRVYVDSGSSDDSVAWARAEGVSVVELDMRIPFTAARARNAGWRRLVAEAPGLRHVQFVDGDSELAPGWLALATAHLMQHPQVAAVAGRLRERHPEATLYNRLCDAEWNTPVGEAEAFGGNACLRLDALADSGGYDDTLIAGEEPELALRLRRRGWRIHRLAPDMGWHDAAMTRFAQWWRRTERTGYTYAEGSLRHGRGPERYLVASARRALVWGALLPLVIVLAALAWSPLAWLALGLYPLQALRLGAGLARAGRPAAWMQGLLWTVGRFAEARGMGLFWWRRWRAQGSRLIEYK